MKNYNLGNLLGYELGQKILFSYGPANGEALSSENTTNKELTENLLSFVQSKDIEEYDWRLHDRERSQELFLMLKEEISEAAAAPNHMLKKYVPMADNQMGVLTVMAFTPTL